MTRVLRVVYALMPALAVALVAAQAQTPAAPSGQQPPRDTSAQTTRTPAPVATGRISGRVIAADTGRAVRAARVTLSISQAQGQGQGGARTA